MAFQRKFKKYNRNKKPFRKYQKKGKQWKHNNAKGVKKVFRKGKTYGVNPDPFPTRLIMRLKFADEGILYSNALGTNTTGNEVVYRLNSIFDPNYSVGGTTVVGYVNVANLYERYIVVGAKVEITFYDPTNDSGVPAVSLNQTTPIQNLTVKQLGENALTYTSIVNNTGSQKKVFNFYVKPWYLQGLSKLEWMANKSTKSALVTANPTDEIYIRLAYANYLTSVNIKYAIRIIYYTELFDRKQLGSSIL